MEAPLRLCAHTRFLGHAPGFWRETSAHADQEPKAYPTGKPIVGRGRILEYLDKFPNLNCDLSAGSGSTPLRHDLDFTRKFVSDYQDRVFLGRDRVTCFLRRFSQAANFQLKLRLQSARRGATIYGHGPIG